MEFSGILKIIMIFLGFVCTLKCVNGKDVKETKESLTSNDRQRLRYDPLIVETRTGLIQGYSMHVSNQEVHAFTGIPYAKPPVGPLRFRKPVTVEPWEGILDATKMPSSCYQESYDYFPGFDGEQMWNANTELSEDCLYLSLWVPQRVRKRHHLGLFNDTFKHKRVPVFIWIYGGGYISGTSTLDVYSYHYLAAHSNAIVATIQYRVGAFGFLYLTPALPAINGDAPGNMGLWDQKMAIEWIKDNAAIFGGDPDLITLFGESAGGGSVSIHMVSPVTKGLAKRGILQSGTMNAPWSYMSGEKAVEIALTLIDGCECNSSELIENPISVMSCMRSVSPSIISKKQWDSYGAILDFPAAPTIDGVFLTKDPMEMVRESNFSDIELIIGSNLNEGTFFLLYDFIDDFDKDGQSLLNDSKFKEIVKAIFRDASDVEMATILYQYTDWESDIDPYVNQRKLGDLVGDYFFICPTNLFANTFTERGGTVFYYFFTQRSSNSPWGEWLGVIHGDEIAYVFGQPLNVSFDYNARERDLSVRIMNTFSRFAATGKPFPDEIEWPRYTKEKPIYYIYNANMTGLGKGPRLTACEFWNRLIPIIRSYTRAEVEECITPPVSKHNVQSFANCHTISEIILIFPILLYTFANYLPTN